MQAMTFVRALVLASLLCAAAHAVGAEPVGVVLMHGKWGNPGKNIVTVELALKGAGFRVVSKEMAWSDRRAYDMSLDQVMTELEGEVAALRAAGAAKIVLGGQSFGANMALAYGARHPDVDGVMVLAPGHSPERFSRDPAMAQSLDKARAMVAAGKGEQIANFQDINQGRTRQVSAKAAVYLSFFDPEGGAVMPRNAARLSSHTALLWVIGSGDPLSSAGRAYAFDRAPANPHSAYYTVQADHQDTPAAARAIVVDWLKGLQ